MRNYKKRVGSKLISITFVFAVILSSTSPVRANNSGAARSQAEIQLSSMSAEEKVGQLFLVTFNGPDTSAAAPIFDLIKDYHLGGVIKCINID